MSPNKNFNLNSKAQILKNLKKYRIEVLKYKIYFFQIIT